MDQSGLPVRNVVLLGYAGSGRTSLARALGGRGTGPWLRLAHGGVTVNLLDDPALLDAAEAALFIVSATQGLDAATAADWEVCADRGVPRAVCVTQLDLPRADFDESVAVCQRVLGEGVHPLAVPMLDDQERVAGTFGLLDLRVHDWSGGERVERDPDPQHVPLVENLRADLIETLLADSDDEGLLDRYLDGEQLPPALLARELYAAVARAAVHPVLPVARAEDGDDLSGTEGRQSTDVTDGDGGTVGVPEVLALLQSGFPEPGGCPAVVHADGSPAEPLHADPQGPLVAEALPSGLVRVWSGTLRGDLRGPSGEPWPSCPAGDLCLAPSGTVLVDPGRPLRVAPR